jgi:hypothetical protein
VDSLLRHADSSVMPGHHYDYRLGWREGFPTLDYVSRDSGLTIPTGLPPSAGFAMSTPWPQPASESLQFSVHFASDRPVRIELYDLTGRRVLERSASGTGDQVLKLETSGLSSGVDLLRATGDGATSTRRAVVLH